MLVRYAHIEHLKGRFFLSYSWLFEQQKIPPIQQFIKVWSFKFLLLANTALGH